MISIFHYAFQHISRPHSPLDWAEPGKVYTQTYLPADHQPTYMMGPHPPNPSKIPNYHTPGTWQIPPANRETKTFNSGRFSKYEYELNNLLVKQSTHDREYSLESQIMLKSCVSSTTVIFQQTARA